VVVHADSVEVESWDDTRLDGAFGSLEHQAGSALSQADLAVRDAGGGDPPPARSGPGWHLQADGQSWPRWPRTRYVAVRSWWGLGEQP
jgi:hypothetical protein